MPGFPGSVLVLRARSQPGMLQVAARDTVKRGKDVEQGPWRILGNWHQAGRCLGTPHALMCLIILVKAGYDRFE